MKLSSSQITTAMVFAAGRGTRMLPITQTLPKPLVHIAGRTMLDHTLDRLHEAGIQKAVVNVHHLGQQVIDAVAMRKTPHIIIADERADLLDQGGGILAALPHLGDGPFIIANTDAVYLEGPSSNLKRLIALYDARAMDFLLLVAATTASTGVEGVGDFLMTPDGRLEKREECAIAPFIYTGFGIMHPRVLIGETRKIFPLAPLFFAAANAGRLYGMRLDGIWVHVGTPQAISEAELVFQDAKR